MSHNLKKRLTSAELGQIWSSYMTDSLVRCVFKYFYEKVEDAEILPVIENGLQCSENHLKQLVNIFKHENNSVPCGFTDDDVTIEAPRLYTDAFFLHFIKHMSRIGLKANSIALALATRSDTVDYYTQCLSESATLNNMATRIMLSKGIYIEPPYIPNQDKVEFVQKQNFLGELFGEKHRPLLAMEITHLYANIQTNALGSALLLGFSQVAKSKRSSSIYGKGAQNRN